MKRDLYPVLLADLAEDAVCVEALELATQVQRKHQDGELTKEQIDRWLQYRKAFQDEPDAMKRYVGLRDSLRGLLTTGEVIKPDLIPLASLQIEPVEWLWEGRIPRANISHLYGDGGCGKSQISLSVAASVTSGKPLPDGLYQDCQEDCQMSLT